MKNALDREKFLKQITEECTKETGLKLDAAKKMLLGDLSYRSKEAQVNFIFYFKNISIAIIIFAFINSALCDVFSKKKVSSMKMMSPKSDSLLSH